MLHADGKTLVVTGSDDMALTNALKQAGAEVARISSPQKTIDLKELFRHLVWLEVNEVLVEAGATWCGALLQQGLVDELILYYAPHILGSHERGMFTLPPLTRMADRVNVEISDVRALGKDWRVIASVSEK